jgi:predicted RNA binding protein YcfA (HicA-like mRNA interferase family)
MKLPRNVSDNELIKFLQKIGDFISRQKGNLQLSCNLPSGEHLITIPNQDPIKMGTLSSILSDISQAHKISKQELINKIFK